MEIVNGFACRDCADASLASRGVDPARPADGVFGILAKQAKEGVEIARDLRAVDQSATKPAASLRHEGAVVDVRA